MIRTTTILLVTLLLAIMRCAKSLNIFPGSFKSRNVESMKSELLQLSRKVQCGLTESPEERVMIKDLFEKLERSNPRKATLSNPDLNAVWSLEYTTSDSILGRGGPQKIGPILQTIDAVNLKAKNEEVVKYFGLFEIQAKVTADLEPISPSKVWRYIITAAVLLTIH